MNCIPFLRYEDAPGALDWLAQAFDFERSAVHEGPDGTIAHAEMRYGGGRSCSVPHGSATSR